MAYKFENLPAVSTQQRATFDRQGFLVVERLLDAAQIDALRERFPRLFAGQFDTGIYPDEWYWREGMSLPDVTRHMANAWKCDLTVAKLALSEAIGRFAADLCGWDGVRLGQDTIWWKAPLTKPIAYHQDTSFMDFFDPPSTITCWVTLDETHRDAGTLEYAPGSHKWPLTALPEDFHGKSDYRSNMAAAACTSRWTSTSRVAGCRSPWRRASIMRTRCAKGRVCGWQPNMWKPRASISPRRVCTST